MKEISDKQKNRRAFWLALDFVFQVGLLIALPLVFFAWLGKILDDRLRSSPLFLIVGLLAGLLIGCYGTWRKVKEIINTLADIQEVKSKK